MQSFLKLFSSTRGSDGALSDAAGLSNDDMSMAAVGRLSKGSHGAGVGVGGGGVGGGESESAARLRSLNPFTEAQCFAGHSDAVRVLVQIDEQRLVSGGDDGRLCLWNVNEGRLLRVLVGHQSRITSVAFLKGGRLVSAAADHTVRIWDPHSGECIRTLTQHQGTVKTIVELEDGLFCCGGDHLALYSTQGSLVGLHSRLNEDSALHTVIAIKSSRLVAASNSNKLEVFSVGEQNTQSGPLGALVDSGTGGARGISMAARRRLNVDDAPKMPVGSAPPLSTAAQHSASAAREGAVGEEDAYGNGWDAQQDAAEDALDLFKVLRGTDAEDDVIRCLLHASDGIFASASLGGVIQLWSSFSLTSVRRLDQVVPLADVKALGNYTFQLVPLDNYMLAAAVGHGFVIYNINLGTVVAHVQNAHSAAVEHLLPMCNGRLLLTAGMDACVRLWSLAHLFDDATESGEPSPGDPLEAAYTLLSTPLGSSPASRRQGQQGYGANSAPSPYRPPSSPRSSPSSPRKPGTYNAQGAKSASAGSKRGTPSKPKGSPRRPKAGSRGSLLPPCIGEMQGHSNSVNRLVSCGLHMFASCGSDSMVILWTNGAWQWRQRNLIAAHIMRRETGAED